MQNVKITFADLTAAEARVSDVHAEEFRRWLRFANQKDEFQMIGFQEKWKRSDIVRAEIAPE